MSHGAFEPSAFDSGAFNVHDEVADCVPAFNADAFENTAFQVCVDAPVVETTGGGWIDYRHVEQAQRAHKRRKREIWRSIERTIEDAYADAKGIPKAVAREEVKQALAPRDPVRVETLARQLAQSSEPQAQQLVQAIEARLAELEAAAIVYERMQEQARILWRQEEDAIAVLLLAS